LGRSKVRSLVRDLPQEIRAVGQGDFLGGVAEIHVPGRCHDQQVKKLFLKKKCEQMVLSVEEIPELSNFELSYLFWKILTRNEFLLFD
jgi:hypothetical protein